MKKQLKTEEEAIRDMKILKKLSEMPKDFQRTYKKAIEGKNPAIAIKAFCSECCMYQRNEITNCTAVTCPLFAYRPFLNSSVARITNVTETAEPSKSIGGNKAAPAA